MSSFHSFVRNAEGVTVLVSEPSPRCVTISRDDLSSKMKLEWHQAEGLLYALRAALDEAKQENKAIRKHQLQAVKQSLSKQTVSTRTNLAGKFRV